MKNLFSFLLLSFVVQAYSQPKMQGTIKQSGANKIDVYLKASASFSQKDEAMTFALAIPATVLPAPATGSSGITANGLGPVAGITGLQPNFLVSNLGTTQREVLVSAENINGVRHYIYIFIFAGTADNTHDWTANVEQQVFSISFEGCTADCNFEKVKLVSLPNGGSTSQGFWYFQSNTLGDITNYAAPFYGNSMSRAPINGGSSDGSALSLLELASASPLPVKLISFNASSKDCHVNLSWQTTEARNFAYFAIERGENATAFREIGRVDAPANSTKLKSYGFIDNTAPTATLLYRLRFVDKDGSYEYSPVKSVTLNCRGKNSVLVYPTLSTGIVNVKLPPGMENSKITVVNSLGEVVIVNEGKTLDRKISLEKLTNGTYTVSVSNSNKITDIKVVLQH